MNPKSHQNIPIAGMEVSFNKVIKDERGFLAELMPEGTKNKLAFEGIRNIYTSVATGKNISRAGHYHFRNWENFFTLTGSALWYFRDYRQDSPTFEKDWFAVLGEKSGKLKDIDDLTLAQGFMAQVLVPPGVYHIFWPLTDEKIIVIAVASEPYSPQDYLQLEVDQVPKLLDKLKKLGLDHAQK